METDSRILDIASKVRGKRPKTVINHIIEHGFITNEDLKDIYGYNHPPRAIRDVREAGIPLETYYVKGKDGRKTAAYRFGNPADIQEHKLGGRKVFSKQFKIDLIRMYGSRDAITGETYHKRYLQIDHRIPYEVAGEDVGSERTPEKFMLLSGASQRQKSWSCEHCQNLLTLRKKEICQTCYWASPEAYTHVAMEEIRQVEIVWMGDEIEDYELIRRRSEDANKSIQDYIKSRLREEN